MGEELKNKHILTLLRLNDVIEKCERYNVSPKREIYDLKLSVKEYLELINKNEENNNETIIKKYMGR